MSNRDVTKGTIMVDAIVRAFNTLKEDVNLVEFLRILQSICVENNITHQTPQFAAFPHRRIIMHKE
jgi:hypothetical protein